MKNKLRAKAIVSSLLLVCTIIIAISGIALFSSNSGIILGIPRLYITTLHAIISLIMAAGIAVHFMLNIKVYKKELKQFSKAEKTTEKQVRGSKVASEQKPIKNNDNEAEGE